MMLPELQLIDAGVLIVAAALLSVVALAAAILPARAAASVPPARIHV
jgi:hypothetical protein